MTVAREEVRPGRAGFAPREGSDGAVPAWQFRHDASHMALLTRRARPLPAGWGIVSTGSIAHAFANDLALGDGAHVTAVCSREAARAAAFAAGHSGAALSGKLRSVRPYDDLDAMLADPVVEMIYVASINTAHRETVLRALDRGRPVLCEKPLATSAAEAREMARMARRSRTLLMEAVWTRHLPAVRAARRHLERGRIGRLVAIRGDLTKRRAFDPASRLFDPGQGGGALLDLGVYPLSLAILFAGLPDRVEGRWWANRAGSDSRAEMRLVSGMGDGAVDIQLACGFTDEHRNRFVLQGTRGAIVLDDTLRPGAITLHDAPLDPLPPVSVRRDALYVVAGWLPGGSSGGRTENHPVEGRGLRPQALRMAECVRDGLTECPDMPLEDSIAALEVIDAILAEPPAGRL